MKKKYTENSNFSSVFSIEAMLIPDSIVDSGGVWLVTVPTMGWEEGQYSIFESSSQYLSPGVEYRQFRAFSVI